MRRTMTICLTLGALTGGTTAPVLAAILASAPAAAAGTVICSPDTNNGQVAGRPHVSLSSG
jgi:hypothetical protein